MNYEELKRHIGHNIVCVGYRKDSGSRYENVAIECEDCNEVIISEDEDIDEDKCPYCKGKYNPKCIHCKGRGYFN